MSLAANALTTVANVKAAAPVAVADARVELVIGAVSADMEAYTGRKFAKTTIETTAPDYYTGSGDQELHLIRLPIVSITRVRVWGATVTDYFRTSRGDEIGCLYRGTAPCYEYRWGEGLQRWPDLTEDPCRRPAMSSLNVDVCGVFGFVLPKDATQQAPQTLPLNLEDACIRETLRRLWRPVPGIKTDKTAGAWEFTWEQSQNPFGFSDETLATLNPYCLPGRWFA